MDITAAEALAVFFYVGFPVRIPTFTLLLCDFFPTIGRSQAEEAIAELLESGTLHVGNDEWLERPEQGKSMYNLAEETIDDSGKKDLFDGCIVSRD